MFIEGAAITVVYFIIRFLEMRFVSGESLPVKTMVQNVLCVYASALIGLYTLRQFNHATVKGKSVSGGGGGVEDSGKEAPVFTGAPGF
jgi:hypothetical protein